MGHPSDGTDSMNYNKQLQVLRQMQGQSNERKKGKERKLESLSDHAQDFSNSWDVLGFMGFIVKLLSRSSDTVSRWED